MHFGGLTPDGMGDPFLKFDLVMGDDRMPGFMMRNREEKEEQVLVSTRYHRCDDQSQELLKFRIPTKPPKIKDQDDQRLMDAVYEQFRDLLDAQENQPYQIIITLEHLANWLRGEGYWYSIHIGYICLIYALFASRFIDVSEPVSMHKNDSTF